MYKIAICDDEKLFAAKLEEWILEYFSKIGSECHIDVYYAGEDLIKNLSLPFPYQIIFLDINMKQVNGIETAAVLREYSEKAVLIFVTAFIKYTIEGYKVEALRYILKDDVNIRVIVKEALDVARKKVNLCETLIHIPFTDGILAVDKENIVYIECRQHQIIFYIKGEDGIENHIIRATMEKGIGYMDQNTVRTHQSFAVNLKYGERLFYDHMILAHNITVPVSRTYAKQTKEKFYNYKGVF